MKHLLGLVVFLVALQGASQETLYNNDKQISQYGYFKDNQLWEGRRYQYNESGSLISIKLYKEGKYAGEEPAEEILKREYPAEYLGVRVQGAGQDSTHVPIWAFLKGSWAFNGVGGLFNEKNLNPADMNRYMSMPIRANDTIVFLEAMKLRVNDKVYPYTFRYSWIENGANESSYWNTYMSVDGREYFIHYWFSALELQYTDGNLRWYGRFTDPRPVENHWKVESE